MHTRPAYMQVYLNTLNIYIDTHLTLPQLIPYLILSISIVWATTLSQSQSLSPTHMPSSPPPLIALTLPSPCIFTSPLTLTYHLSPTHRNSLLMILICSPPFFKVRCYSCFSMICSFLFCDFCVCVRIRICVCDFLYLCLDFCVCVYVCDFEKENHKSQIFVFLVSMFVFVILGRAW